jgi:prepilin peptidase CpaA
MPIEQYLDASLLLLVCTAAINDLATRRIPNRLLLAGVACACLLRLFMAHPAASMLTALAGMGVGLAMFLPIYVLRGMAAGDVKMIAAVGAFTGPGEVFEIAVLTWCAGGVIALCVLLVRSRLRLALTNIAELLAGSMVAGNRMAGMSLRQSAGSIPYGLAIAIGTFAVLIRH